jgi:hypothetical protein
VIECFSVSRLDTVACVPESLRIASFGTPLQPHFIVSFYLFSTPLAITMGIPLYRPPTPPVDPLSANVRNNNGVHRRAALSRRFPSREHSSQTFLDLLRSNSDFSRERSPSRHLSNIPSRLFPRISDDDPSATFSPYMQWRRVNDWAEPFNRNSAPRWRRRFDQMRREMLEREGYLSMEDREREQVDTSVPSLANLPIHPFDAGSDSLHQRYETAPSSMSAVETAPYRRSIALHRQQPDAISSQGSTTTDENERPDTSSTAANPGSSNSSAILRRRLPATRDLTAPRHINFFDNLGDRDRSQRSEPSVPHLTLQGLDYVSNHLSPLELFSLFEV